MQHAENGSILDLIHKERRIPEPRACHLFRQIMSAVAYCHAQEVAHRDLKCENILLDAKFNVKLIDFGFAKCFKSVPATSGEKKMEALYLERGVLPKIEKDTNLSETYCGSYAYASPEILKGIPYDPFLSDVWAMGCVLFAMVFGRLPFDDKDPAKLIKVSSFVRKGTRDNFQPIFFFLSASSIATEFSALRRCFRRGQGVVEENARSIETAPQHRAHERGLVDDKSISRLWSVTPEHFEENKLKAFNKKK